MTKGKHKGSTVLLYDIILVIHLTILALVLPFGIAAAIHGYRNQQENTRGALANCPNAELVHPRKRRRNPRPETRSVSREVPAGE